MKHGLSLETVLEKRPGDEDRPFSAAKGFSATTIPELFLERCSKTPHKVAFRYKDLGIYQEVTWEEYREKVESFALGLISLGLKKGDRVAIMGDTCPEWLYADVGAVCAGAITFGIYQTSAVAQTKHELEHSEAKFFIAEDQEYVDKVLVCGDLPHLQKLIVADTSAMFMYDDPRIMSFKEVQEKGRALGRTKPELFFETARSIKPEDLFAICYTSGTTGVPKAAIFTHRAWLWGWLNSLFAVPPLMSESTRTVGYMPLAHLLGRGFDIYLPMLGGYTVHIGESPDQMAETVYDVSPNVFVGAPRTYEKLAAQVLVGMQSTSLLKNLCYRAAMTVGRRYIKRRWEGKPSLAWQILYCLAYWGVFRHILYQMGFSQVKTAVIGAAPVPPEVVTLWQIWGLNLVEILGMTEAGTVLCQQGHFPRPGNCGVPAERVQIRTTEEGELIVKTPALFAGYFKDEEATQKAFRDGWLLTGDVLEQLPNGCWKHVDRANDIMVTAGGKNVSPAEIEKALKASPFISEAIAIAHGRKFPAALVEIDFDTVTEWSRRNGVTYTSFQSLIDNAKIIALIDDEIRRCNSQLARVEQVKKFRLLPKELDPEDETDPITPTRKVQRRRMLERFDDLVDSIYADDSDVSVIREEVADVIKAMKLP